MPVSAQQPSTCQSRCSLPWHFGVDLWPCCQPPDLCLQWPQCVRVGCKGSEERSQAVLSPVPQQLCVEHWSEYYSSSTAANILILVSNCASSSWGVELFINFHSVIELDSKNYGFVLWRGESSSGELVPLTQLCPWRLLRLLSMFLQRKYIQYFFMYLC